MKVSPLVRPVILQPSPVAWGYPPTVCWLRPYPHQSRQETPLPKQGSLPNPDKIKRSKNLTFHLILSSILASLGIIAFSIFAYLHFNEVNNAANNATKASNLKNIKDQALIAGVICSVSILYSTYTLSKIIKNQNPLKILAIYTALAALTSSILYKAELIGNLGEFFSVLIALSALFSPFLMPQKIIMKHR